MDKILTPFSQPLYVMAKPAGAGCNLACEYCYYLEKKMLYADGSAGGKFSMSDSTLERFVSMYIQSQTTPEVLFCWHGGEALLRPISFYRRVVELQQKYGAGRRIENSIQTNGILLNDEWCRFLREQGWLVGISVDGPKEFHDEYRRTRGGGPTFERVMRGINMLKRYGVEWNGMAVVNDYNADHPDEFYDFFRQIGCRYIQFTPIVERDYSGAGPGPRRSALAATDLPVAPFSVSPGQWGDFLCAVFDRWVRSDVGSYFVQLFDATLANWVGQTPGVCSMAQVCGHAGVMEHNGDVYSCDHFVYPEYKLGNIHTHTLVEMMASGRQQQFGLSKRASLPGQCLRCDYLFACNGECPKNRIATSADGEAGLNYLCEGYHKFFAHAAPYMDFMAAELKADRPPANVMDAIRQGRIHS